MPHQPTATVEPKRIRAGDTAVWTRRVPGHSHTDGWSLRYAFAGSEVLTVDATPGADPETYEITITASESGTLPAGGYRWVARVRRNAGELERHTIGEGLLVVEPDLSSLEDGRTDAERMVSLIQEALLSLRSDGIAQISINNRSISYRGEEGLRTLESRLRFWEDRVRAERGRLVIGNAAVSFKGVF